MGSCCSMLRIARLWLGAFLLWTAIAIAFATQLYFAGLSWSQALSWTLPRWYAWGLVTPGIFWVDRWLSGNVTLPVRVGLHVPLGIAWTLVTIALRGVNRVMAGTFPGGVAAFVAERLYADLPIYAVLAGISFSRIYAAQMRQSDEAAHQMALRTTDLERRLVESRLQSLRAQLQPHFLFNALNTISAFTESNPQMARRLMAQLGGLLRASLRHASQPVVPLGDELTFLDDFLAIEAARLEGRVRFSVEADDDLLGIPVPSFLLQPLVENAVRHGVGARLAGGHVSVTATGTRSALAIRVRDDGVGLPDGWSFERDAGVGLRNVAARLEHLYARPGLLRVVPIESGGVEIRIDLPGEPVWRPDGPVQGYGASGEAAATAEGPALDRR